MFNSNSNPQTPKQPNAPQSERTPADEARDYHNSKFAFNGRKIAQMNVNGEEKYVSTDTGEVFGDFHDPKSGTGIHIDNLAGAGTFDDFINKHATEAVKQGKGIDTRKYGTGIYDENTPIGKAFTKMNINQDKAKQSASDMFGNPDVGSSKNNFRDDIINQAKSYGIVPDEAKSKSKSKSKSKPEHKPNTMSGNG
jgi:hypothetical protein